MLTYELCFSKPFNKQRLCVPPTLSYIHVHGSYIEGARLLSAVYKRLLRYESFPRRCNAGCLNSYNGVSSR